MRDGYEARGVRALKKNGKVALSGPSLAYEQAWLARGISPVAGIDEAGRGPWAGPVVAAAVVLDAGHIPAGINDSKKLNAAARERLFEDIMNRADVGVGIADVARIDRENILRATLWAMVQAVAALPRAPGGALVDGTIAPDLTCPVETIIEGDGRSFSIAAASIIAKVTRDRMMIALAREHPGYGWERNKGYGVAEHRAGIVRLGLTPHHRRSFRPIALVAKQ
jgi:ribonuclease HII